MTPQRWLTAIPLKYAEGPAFWGRDAGLTCLGLREAGAPCRFVALGPPSDSENPPLILTELARLSDAGWWKQWRADVVLFNSWGAPRHEPVARAIREAGCKLIVRLDSDGVFSPRFDFFPFLARTYGSYRDEERRFPGALALAKAGLFRLRRSIYDDRFVAHLRHANAVVAESSIAAQRYRTYLLRAGEPELAARMHALPHPTDDLFSPDPGVKKEPRLVAVGRWRTWQKDTPRLLQCLGEILRRAPDYRATIFGSGDDIVRRLASRLEPAVRERIEISGPVPPARLLEEYRRSQIVFAPSRYESFHIAAAEGLCCGASVVGSPALPSFIDFAGAQSGTVSTSRSVNHLVEAVGAEIQAWRDGRRDPAQISGHWRGIVSATAVGKTLVEMFPKL